MIRAFVLSLLSVSLLVVPATDSHARSTGPSIGADIGGGILQWLRPNLVVESVDVIELQGDVVDTPLVRIRIKNIGLLSASKFGADAWMNINGKFVLRKLWLSNGLAAGATYTWYIYLHDCPVVHNQTQHYAISAMADSGYNVTESSESDNWLQLVTDE